MLRKFIGTRTSGLFFKTSSGSQLLQANTLQDSLHPILEKLKHVKGGFNIFRRFRITHIKKGECPDFLQDFWSGHAPRHVSERYTKLIQDRAFRLRWADQLGTGFDLSAANLGRPGRLVEFPKSRLKALQAVDSQLVSWWTRPGSNRRPPRCERGALPAELLAQLDRTKQLVK
jgi:hypothetical protein